MPELILAVLIIAAVVLFFLHAPKQEDSSGENTTPEIEPTPKPQPPFALSKYTEMRLASRNQHHLIVAPTGHGKTEFMKLMMLDDIETNCAMVVIDTKGDLIDDLLAKRAFCSERTILIDPRDIEHPFNLGFINFAGMKNLKPLDREIAYNGAIDLLTITLGALDAEMTTKQETLFGMIFRLLEKVPDASILTMLDILKRNSRPQFQPYINQLDPLYQSFFEEMFYGSREYNETKDQVSRRLYDIFNNPVLRQAFLDPSPQFSMQQALNDRSIILINLSTMVLKNFAPVFGRFMMARVLQAVEERRDRRVPVLVYADEAADYLDQSTDAILRKARSANLGLIIATQDLSKIPSEIRDVVLSNTLIKSVGRLPAADARKILATVKGPATPEEIIGLEEGSMYTFSHKALSHYRGQLSYVTHRRNFIGQFKAELEPSTKAERNAVRERMRQLYGVRAPRNDNIPNDDEDFDPTIAKPFAP